MKNINFLIEKACIDYCEQVDSVYNEKDVFQAGAHFALSLFKWRKVEEEMPEEYITVLIKNRTGKIMSVYRCDVNEWCIIGTNDLVNPETIEYWMPIPQID